MFERRTATEQKWAERVQAWRESGLTAREFSTGRDFSAGGLRHWAYRLKRGGTAASAASTPATTPRRKVPQGVRVARVERISAPTSATLMVEIGPARLHVPARVDRPTLRATIAALVEATTRGGGR
jgi:hypothetical protein